MFLIIQELNPKVSIFYLPYELKDQLIDLGALLAFKEDLKIAFSHYFYKRQGSVPKVLNWF